MNVTNVAPDGLESGSGGSLDATVTTLRAWDPAWAAALEKMTSNPWRSQILPRKFIELVGLALNAACTNLNPEGTRHQVRAALAAGANRTEILAVLKMASLLSIHSCSLGAPILMEEARLARAELQTKPPAATPACDKLRAAGLWNVAWDPFFELDPTWTDEFMACGAGIYVGGVFTPKEAELLSIAFDASFTHMYAPGTRRHIKGALKAGATPEEIMEVLKLCVIEGARSAIRLGVPILAEELPHSAQT